MVRIILFLLSLLLASSTMAVPSSFPTLTIPDCLGINTHFSVSEQAQVDKIAAAGFKVVRTDVYWNSVEKEKGVYDFSAYDALVDSLAPKGIRPLFLLEYRNLIYGDDHPFHSETGKAAFIAYARACADHFKGKGVIWDVINEPNRHLCGIVSPDPYRYTALVKSVYPVIKKAAPDALVVAPSTNRWDYGFIESAFKAGLLDCVDAVSVHPYEPNLPEDSIAFYTKVQSLMKRYSSKQVPLICGEWGFNTSKWGISLDQQAQILSRVYLINMMCGCPVSIWYDWRNDGINYENSEHNYGVVFNDFSEKPAYVAMQTLSTELNGYTYSRRIFSETGNDFALLFRKGDDYRLAAWTTGNPHKITIPMDVPSVTVVSLTGEKQQIRIEKGSLSLKLSQSVQYIEPSIPSRRWAAEAAWEITERTGYKWDGSTEPYTKAINTTINPPLTRVIKLDKSAYPSINLLAPVNGKLVVEVNLPSGKPFNGKLLINGLNGIKLASSTYPARVASGQSKTTIALDLADQPQGIFTFACSLIDQKGRLIARLPARRYSILEIFGKDKTYSAKFDGTAFTPWSDDPKNASGEASLTYVKDSEVDACARLDYSLKGAKCSADIVPDAPVKLDTLPQSLKVWIKGDENCCSLRSEIKDAGKEIYQPDWGIIDFTDWRCIEMDMTSTSGDHIGGRHNGRMDCPLNWTKLLIFDNMARDIKGSVYIGSMLLCYE